jgi:hypothetical protein
MEETQKQNENQDEEILRSEFSQEPSEALTKGKIAFLLVIGFLLGVSIKAQALRTVTIGYSDYKLKKFEGSFDLKPKQTPEQNQEQMPEQSPNDGQTNETGEPAGAVQGQ